MVYNDFDAFALRMFAEVAVAEAFRRPRGNSAFDRTSPDIGKCIQIFQEPRLFCFFMFFACHNHPKNHPKNHDHAMIFLSIREDAVVKIKDEVGMGRNVMNRSAA